MLLGSFFPQCIVYRFSLSLFQLPFYSFTSFIFIQSVNSRIQFTLTSSFHINSTLPLAFPSSSLPLPSPHFLSPKNNGRRGLKHDMQSYTNPHSITCSSFLPHTCTAPVILLIFSHFTLTPVSPHTYLLLTPVITHLFLSWSITVPYTWIFFSFTPVMLPVLN